MDTRPQASPPTEATRLKVRGKDGKLYLMVSFLPTPAHAELLQGMVEYMPDAILGVVAVESRQTTYIQVKHLDVSSEALHKLNSLILF